MTTVFVTVGTTSFDKLVSTVCGGEIPKTLHALGFRRIVVQIGRSEMKPNDTLSDLLQWDIYEWKDSISEDIKNADLVISHAGAGSVLECLRAKKKLIVVVNDNLMNNHQLELAREMSRSEYLSYCTCVELKDTLLEQRDKQYQAFPASRSNVFAEFLDKAMGLV